ncbi:hypothetical protein [Rhodoglobus vestalii]|uniref:hypothetical protein n=1 Tax=Rhodoglobus vestalii TaxID=193384 RepID=UPI0014772FC1|nr:hypothetical protein [Rhodoglobus vestalii]
MVLLQQLANVCGGEFRADGRAIRRHAVKELGFDRVESSTFSSMVSLATSRYTMTFLNRSMTLARLLVLPSRQEYEMPAASSRLR